MTCLHCGATTSNGLALCELCRRRASDCLEFLPVYFRNLARWKRPGRPNGSLGTTGQWLIRRGDAQVEHIAKALERTSNDLTTWSRTLADDRGVELPDEDTEAATVAALCETLTANLSSVATLEWAGQFLRDMDRHERILRGLTECYVPGWYAGACRRCQTATFVMPGLTWVTCGGCGATTFARDHLDAVLSEASDWIARPKRIAEAVVALVDSEDSVSKVYTRIRQWAHQGDIHSFRHTTRGYDYDEAEQRMVVVDEEVGYARYRMGDVLELVLRRDTRTATDAEAS